MNPPAHRRPASHAARGAARPPGEVVRHDALVLDTRLRDELRVPDIPIGEWGVEELRRSFRRLSIASELHREDGDLVLRYECTIREAIRLGYDQGGRREIARALLDTYPELAEDEIALERRIRALKAEWARVDAASRAAES